jgi:hypothetical protein
MASRFLQGTLTALLLAAGLGAVADVSDARELRQMRVRLPTYGGQSWGEGTILPRERHVLERRPGVGGIFLMNGSWYQAMAGHCRRWAANDRITLRAGDWHGGPVLVRNVRRGRTCGFWPQYS